MARIHGRIAPVYLVDGNLEKAAEHYQAEPVEWVRNVGEILSAIANDGDWQPMAVAYEE